MRLAVSERGLGRAWADDAFLLELVGLCPHEDLNEPFDDSDAWWWLCSKLDAMKRYGRKDLKQTARLWVKRASIKEIIDAREAGANGSYDHLIPLKDLHEARTRAG